MYMPIKLCGWVCRERERVRSFEKQCRPLLILNIWGSHKDPIHKNKTSLKFEKL